MNALIVSLESFQKGTVPDIVIDYIKACKTSPFIILDESSKIKTNNPCKEAKKSKRTQAVLALSCVGERCILTGTFMSKSPVNAYDQMNFLKKGFFPESMFAFAEHYTIRRSLPSVRGARVLIDEKTYKYIHKMLNTKDDNPFVTAGLLSGMSSRFGVSEADCLYIKEHPEYSPFKNVDELWKRIGNTCLKVDRKDVFEMKEKQYKTLYCKLTKEQKKLYTQLQNQHCTEDITVENGLQLYIRFQDICNGYNPVETDTITDENGKEKVIVELERLPENPKLDLLEEAVSEIGNNQIVVWCSRSLLLEDAYKRLTESGYVCGIYDGKTAGASRDKAYKEFAEGNIQILFCNQRSAGFGLDGLKNCNYEIYLCSSYSVEERVQSEDRCYRGQVKNDKYIIDIICKGTVEDKVVEALKQGKELLKSGRAETALFRLDSDQ